MTHEQAPADAPALAAPPSAAATRARVHPTTIAVVAVTVAVFAFVYRPLFLWLADNWIANPYYNHALLVIPIAGLVAWKRRARFLAAPKRVVAADYAWLAVAGTLLIAGRAAASNYLQGWSLLPLAVGVLLVTQGRDRVRVLTWPLAFLVFVFPIPFLEGVFGPLQAMAAIGAAKLSALAGLDVTYNAVSLSVDGMEFAVVPLCAGLSSTLSLGALCAVCLLLWPVRMMYRVGVYALVIPIALVANMGRIATTVVVATRAGPDAAFDFFHGPGGVLLYIVALAGMGACVWGARRLQGPAGGAAHA